MGPEVLHFVPFPDQMPFDAFLELIPGVIRSQRDLHHDSLTQLLTQIPSVPVAGPAVNAGLPAAFRATASSRQDRLEFRVYAGRKRPVLVLSCRGRATTVLRPGPVPGLTGRSVSCYRDKQYHLPVIGLPRGGRLVAAITGGPGRRPTHKERVDRMRVRTGSRRAAWFAGFWGIALVLLLAVGARAQDPNRFENAIQAFEAADRASPPPAEPVLFVGSSTIRMWTDLAAAFPEHAVLNRGFGGSHMSDLLHYFDRVVAVYEPALVLVYEGDNDLASGKSVDHVYAEYVTFLDRVKRQLPGTDVAFLAVKPSPSRVKHLEAMRQLNVRLAALAAEDPVLWFIDVFTPMLDAAGQPRPELFGPDLLHMNAAGYALWQKVIGPLLEEWSASRGQTFLFDFGAADLMTGHGPSPNDPVNYWNNVTETIGGSATGILRGVVNTRNQPTDIVLQMLSPFNGSGPGRSGTVKSTRFVPNATAD
ncbi:MAG: hypothetical protein FJ280_32050, partial [Planctomycetes bacterium]|nr:hypothetical protein [Planctomycetota bacterium]